MSKHVGLKVIREIPRLEQWWDHEPLLDDRGLHWQESIFFGHILELTPFIIHVHESVPKEKSCTQATTYVILWSMILKRFHELFVSRRFYELIHEHASFFQPRPPTEVLYFFFNTFIVKIVQTSFTFSKSE